MRRRGVSAVVVVAFAATAALAACAPVVRPAVDVLETTRSLAAPAAPPVETPPAPVVEPVETPTPPVEPAPVVEPVETPPTPIAPPAEPVETPPAPPTATTDGTVDLSLPGALPAAGSLPVSGPTFGGPAPIEDITSSDVEAQMAYLHAHWNNYNTAMFGDFNAWGGDCANFVSQSLWARGWDMTWEWYNDWKVPSWTASWVHVPSFNSWLNAHRAEYGATPVSFDDRERIKVGDLVVFDWDNNNSLDHIQVVSRVTVVDGQTKIEMIGHNTDVEYRDLDSVISAVHPGATGWFWSLDY